jgi:hypothetical protein
MGAAWGLMMAGACWGCEEATARMASRSTGADSTEGPNEKGEGTQHNKPPHHPRARKTAPKELEEPRDQSNQGNTGPCLVFLTAPLAAPRALRRLCTPRQLAARAGGQRETSGQRPASGGERAAAGDCKRGANTRHGWTGGRMDRRERGGSEDQRRQHTSGFLDASLCVELRCVLRAACQGRQTAASHTMKSKMPLPLKPAVTGCAPAVGGGLLVVGRRPCAGIRPAMPGLVGLGGVWTWM